MTDAAQAEPQAEPQTAPLTLRTRVRRVLLAVFLVGVAMVSALATMQFVIHGAEVKVPALGGMTVADARNQTAALGLNLIVDNRYYSVDVPAGHILTQSPAAGQRVRREWRMRVAESLGVQNVDVPDVTGKSEQEAALILRRSGLEVGDPATIAFAGARPGTVIAQDPPGHAQGIARPSVTLLVAAAEEPSAAAWVMPDLVGEQAEAAQAMLARAGIHAAAVAYVSAAVPSVSSAGEPAVPVRPGAVTAQWPAAGSRVDAATAVRLTAAR